jgi:hypothetical protein
MGGLFLNGCSYADLFDRPKGVTTPQPSQIAQYVSQTETGATDGTTGRRITAGEYLVATLGYTNESCHAFFDVLERFKDDNSLFGKVLDAAAAAGTPLLGYVAGSDEALRFASSVTLGKQINTSLGEIYTYVAHRDQLKRHVLQAMSDFRQINGLSLLTRSLIGLNEFTRSTSRKYNPIYYGEKDGGNCSGEALAIDLPTTPSKDGKAVTAYSYQIDQCKLNSFLRSSAPIHLLVARNIATEYASLCSLSNLKTIIGDALSKTKSEVKTPDSSATTTVSASDPAAEAAAESARAAAAAANRAAGKAENSASAAEEAATDAKAAVKKPIE